MTDDEAKNKKFASGGVNAPRHSGLGFSDFNAGNVDAALSKCLRKAALPTACTRCLKGCPAQALKIPAADGLPKVTGSCLHCGLCVELCPTTAISTMRETPQMLAQRLIDACLKTKRLVITCERTVALLRMRSKGENADETDVKEFDEFEKLRKNHQVRVVPCLGMMGPELWFILLNEIGYSQLQKLDILLPFEQCKTCPVNTKAIAERMFESAIGIAERWTNHSVGLYAAASEASKASYSLLAPLREATSREASFDRRDAFTGAFKSLRDVWNNAVEAAQFEAVLNMTSAEEAQLKRQRRDAYMNTVLGRRLAANKQAAPRDLLSSRDPQPLTSKSSGTQVVPKRYLLVESLGCNPANAGTVALRVSATNEAACIGCERCLKACVLQARSLNKNQKAFVDALTCIGCGACVNVCRESACSFATISGNAFLLNPPVATPAAAPTATPTATTTAKPL